MVVAMVVKLVSCHFFSLLFPLAGGSPASITVTCVYAEIKARYSYPYSILSVCVYSTKLHSPLLNGQLEVPVGTGIEVSSHTRHSPTWNEPQRDEAILMQRIRSVYLYLLDISNYHQI